MRVRRIVSIVVALIATSAAAQLPESIPEAHRTAFTSWLSTHPGFRAAISKDCECDEYIEEMRRGGGGPWAPVPGYQPYLMQGDFDGDGVGDAAIVAITKNAPHKILILASIGGRSGGNAVIQEIPDRDDYLDHRGLFCALPYPETPEQSCRLLFGAFGSESDEALPIRRRAGRS